PAATRAATSARLSPGSSGGPARGLPYLSEKAAASSSVVVGKVLHVPDSPAPLASGAERSACSGTRTLRGFMKGRGSRGPDHTTPAPSAPAVPWPPGETQ